MSWVMKLTAVIDKIKLIDMAMQGQEPRWTYLRDFDPNAFNGRGHIRTTDDLAKARRFDSMAAVFEEWKRPSTTVPYRDDGKPNRPLTACTMEPVEIPDPPPLAA